MLLSGCSWSEVLGLGWPEGHHAARRTSTVSCGSVLLIAALVVGVIVWGLIFWTSAFHRHKKGDTELPRQFGYNMPLELVLTVAPFLIISVLFYFTVVVQEKMLHKDPNPEVVIDVTAFQWNWKFGYQKVNFGDGTFTYDGARQRAQGRDGVRPEGVEASTARELVGAVRGHEPGGPDLPELRQGRDAGHRPPRFPCWCCPSASASSSRSPPPTSIHAFWVPEFLFKRDVMPDPMTEPLRQRLPGQRDQQDRRVRRPMRGDVRHLPLDDELRGSGGGAQRLQGATCSSAWRARPTPKRCAAINQPPTAVTTPSVRHPPRRAGAARHLRRAE